MKTIRTTICLIAISIFYFQDLRSQEEIRDFLVLGVEFAEEIVSAYTQPAAEGLLYGLTGGWYNSAVVRDKWQVEISIVTNGSFVPSESRSFFIDTGRFDNLTTLQGEAVVKVPTILGGTGQTVQFVADVEGEFYQFESPEGIGLSDANILPNAFLQVKVGLPKYTEAGVRVFPKLNIDDVEFGLYGFSAQHEFSRWLKPIQNSPIAFSVMAAYTRLFTDYNFETGGDVTGEDQRINIRMNSWLFELIASTKFKKLNLYGGLGYVTGDADTRLGGTYNFEVFSNPLSFTDPFDFQNEVDGIRANIGLNLRLGWFGLNTAYTFQGFNNFSFGMNFNIK